MLILCHTRDNAVDNWLISCMSPPAVYFATYAGGSHLMWPIY